MQETADSRQELIYGGCGCAGGEVVTIRDAMGRRQRLSHDVLGRVVKTEVLNPDSTTYSMIINKYNARDQLVESRQISGGNENAACPSNGSCQLATIAYDGHGRVMMSQAPIQTASISYAYNPDDTVQSVTDARGVVSTFAYNNRQLVTGVSYNAPAGSNIPATPSATYTYDAGGNRLSMTDGAGSSVSYVYDALSRLTSEARQLPGLSNTYTLSYEYTLAGQLQKITDQAAGTSLSYGHDQVGQMTGVSGTGYGSVSQFASNLQYRAWGAVKHLTYGNNLQLNLNYDVRGQVTRYAVDGVRSSTTSPTFSEGSNYLYYDDGRIKFASGGPAQTGSLQDRAYQYDQAGRLKEAYSGAEARDFINATNSGVADGPYRQSYSYDAWDNLSSRINRFWSVQDNLTASYNEHSRNTAWTYDAAGHILTEDAMQHTYDAAGRHVALAETQYNTNTVTTSNAQSYDCDGQQVKRVQTTSTTYSSPPRTTTTSTTTYYLRSSVLGGRVVAELDAQGTRQHNYVYAGGELLAQQTGTSVTWQHTNPITGNGVTTDAQGVQTAATQLDPMGVDVGDSDPYAGSLGGLTPDPEIPQLLGGSYFPDGRCTLDGIAFYCDQVSNLIEVGAAVQCPNNDCGPRTVCNPITMRNELSLVTWNPNTGQLGYWRWDRTIVYELDENGNRINPTPGEWRQSFYSNSSNFSFLGLSVDGGHPQQTGQQPQPKQDCLTYKMLIDKLKPIFEEAWQRTAKSGKENGGWAFLDPAANKIYVNGASEGGRSDMPKQLGEFNDQLRQFRENGRSVTFILQFHTHPLGSEASGGDILDIGLPEKYSRITNALGVVIGGLGKYSFYDANGRLFNSENTPNPRLNECIRY